MERSTPVRKPHTSTADLLTWSETLPPELLATPSDSRSHQPSDGISKVVFGGQVTDEEVESLLKRKPCSGHKLKEITGSGIFVANGEGDGWESGNANTKYNKAQLHMHQQALAGISQISFGAEESPSLKKPTTLPEVAKQRELSGNLESESDAKGKRHISDAKCKELSGHDIFGAPPEIKHRQLPPRSTFRESKDMEETVTPNGSVHTPLKLSNGGGGQSNSNPIFGEEPVIKTAKKIPNQKFAELSGNDIFKGEIPPSSSEKPLSTSKLREMSGSDIFADGKAESRDHYTGVRKPPGGESSIALV